MKIKRLLLLSLLCASMTSVSWAAATVTNVWVGAKSGGNWSTKSNWKATGASSTVTFGVDQAYDFSSITNGAKIVLDYNYIQPAALIFSKHADDESWTIESSSKSTTYRFYNTKAINVDVVIPAGCTLNWMAIFQFSHFTYQVTMPVYGGGTLNMCGSKTFSAPKCHLILNDSRLLISNTAMSPAIIQLDGDNAYAQLDRDNFQIYGLRSTRGTPTFDLNGRALTISAGYQTMGASNYGGNIIGSTPTAKLDIRNGTFQTFSKASIFNSLYLRTGYLDLPKGSALYADVIETAQDGRLASSNSLWVSQLKGAGILGGVDMGRLTTLSVTGTTTATTMDFSGSIRGGTKFILDAPNTVMTLNGENSHTDGTEVKQGKLVLSPTIATLPEPVAHYEFDDEALPGKDSSPNHYNLITAASVYVPHYKTTGAAVTYDCNPAVITNNVPGAIGKCCYFNQSALVAEAFPSLIPTGNKSFTISVRFQREVDMMGPSIIEWGDYEPSNTYVRVTMGGTPSNLRMEYNANGDSHGSGVATFAFGDYLPTSKFDYRSWVHVVYTYDADTQTQAAYWGGVLMNSSKKAVPFAIVAKDFKLGYTTQARSWGSSGEKFFVGYLDDVRIYDVALSSNQVKTLARSLKTGKTSTTLPEDGDVKVDAGAELSVAAGTDHVFSTLDADGTVNLESDVRLSVSEDSSIAKLTGEGAYRVIGGKTEIENAADFTGVLEAENGVIQVKGPSSAEVKLLSGGSVQTTGDDFSKPIAIAEGFTICAKADGSNVPAVRTTGKVTVPAVAHLAFDSAEDVSRNRIRKYNLVSGVFDAPDLSGWTYTGPEGNYDVTIRCQDNDDGTRTIYANLRFGGTIYVVR